LCEAEEGNIGRILLDIHREWASFWEHIGSTIDNLGLAFQDSMPPIIKGVGREELMRKYPNIAYAYNRRTQFIHSRIVPAKVENNLVQFRARITDRRDRLNEPKFSAWDQPYDSDYVLGDILESEWDIFIKVMTDAWWWLRNELMEKDLKAKDLRKKITKEDPRRQVQELYVAIPHEGTPISNIEMPRYIRIESHEVRNPKLFEPPPPSG
jgi:hypothetical protein